MEHVKGDMELRAHLHALPARLKPNVVAAVQTTIAFVSSQARLDHGADAHMRSRFQTRSGTLVSSIQDSMVTTSGSQIVGKIEVDSVYGAAVELGLGRSKPYPFLFPALIAAQPVYMEQLKTILKG